MKKFLVAIVGVLMLSWQIPCDAGKKSHPFVGGPCTYDEFPGSCTATSVDGEGRTQFTFKGTVKGKKLVLKENKAAEPFAIRTRVDCTLRFITSGTCTPCLLSIGECGREGFEALGSREQQ